MPACRWPYVLTPTPTSNPNPNPTPNSDPNSNPDPYPNPDPKQAALREVALDPLRARVPPATLLTVCDEVQEAARLLWLGDPDRPLKPFEWHRLVERSDDSVAEMVMASLEAPSVDAPVR